MKALENLVKTAQYMDSKGLHQEAGVVDKAVQEIIKAVENIKKHNEDWYRKVIRELNKLK